MVIVKDGDHVRVAKGAGSPIEADSMFLKICSRFLGIPIKNVTQRKFSLLIGNFFNYSRSYSLNIEPRNPFLNSTFNILHSQFLFRKVVLQCLMHEPIASADALQEEALGAVVE